MTGKEYFKINSIVKTFRLIELLATQREFDLGKLTRCLGYPKTTVHRMLLTLKSLGYVIQNPGNQQYGATIKLFELGHKVKENNDLLRTVQPHIEALTEKIGEAVYVVVLDGVDVVIMAKTKSIHSLKQDAPIGYRYRSYNSASGRTILSNLPEEERRRLFRGHRLTPYTQYSPTSYRQLEQMFVEIKKNGCAVEHEEYSLGISCVAAPIFEHTGKVFASVTISGPTVRIKPKTYKLSHLVMATAQMVSAGLGYHPDKEASP